MLAIILYNYAGKTKCKSFFTLSQVAMSHIMKYDYIYLGMSKYPSSVALVKKLE